MKYKIEIVIVTEKEPSKSQDGYNPWWQEMVVIGQ